MTTPVDALAAFGVGGDSPSGTVATMRQRLGPALVDHRGRIELAAYAVLVDTVGGGPFVVATGPDRGVVQARLAFATAGDAIEPEGVLSAQATLRDDGGQFGLTTVEVTDSTGRLRGSVLVRNARTGRVFDPELLARGRSPYEADGGRAVPDTLGTATDVPPRIDPALTGAQVVEAVAAGRLAAGPLAELLSLSVIAGDPARGTGPGLVCTPAAWMANPLGTMHGGVIAAIAAQGCSLTGQAHTAPGQTHTISDFAIDFFRSPPLDAGDLLVTTRPERIGRRLGAVSATFTQADGTLLASATANVRFG
ncbi:PaaI family thioesterase [Williamsia sp. M5A3_1d]